MAGCGFARHATGSRWSVLERLSFGMPVIVVLPPHLEPYYFTPTVLPTYFLFRTEGYAVKTAILLVSALFSLLCTSIYRHGIVQIDLVNCILPYGQILAVMTIIVLFESHAGDILDEFFDEI